MVTTMIGSIRIGEYNDWRLVEWEQCVFEVKLMVPVSIHMFIIVDTEKAAMQLCAKMEIR